MINKNIFLNDFCVNQRGAMLQKKVINDKADFMVLGGKQIKSYFIDDNIKGYILSRDIVDEKADRLMGIHTLVNVFGLRRAAVISFPFLIIPFIGIPVFIDYGLLDHYLWPLTGLMIGSLIVFYLMIIGDTESETLENIHAWSVMYVVYIFYALGFSILTIFQGPLKQLLTLS